mmetsp:Transcript_121521/g.388786  ORF Transcript_121521/g.388786 Transcript_121521/m.388786 type:complete len:255 (-) Transcript_121521:1569-2333(-)
MAQALCTFDVLHVARARLEELQPPQHRRQGPRAKALGDAGGRIPQQQGMQNGHQVPHGRRRLRRGGGGARRAEGLVEAALELVQQPLDEELRAEGADDAVAAGRALDEQPVQGCEEWQGLGLLQQTVAPQLPCPRNKQKHQPRGPDMRGKKRSEFGGANGAAHEPLGEPGHGRDAADLPGRGLAALAACAAGLQQPEQRRQGLWLGGQKHGPAEAAEHGAEQAAQRLKGRQAMREGEPWQPTDQHAKRLQQPSP